MTPFRNITVLLLILILGWALTGCIEEYWPELGIKYENVLVVDGMITSDAGPYTVRLSRSSAVSDAAYLPFTECEVSIQDDRGSNELLTETSSGVYVTNPNGIQGEVGMGYRILITTPQGTRYESDYEEMPAPTGIDSIYYRAEYREVVDGSYPTNGLQFYLDTDLTEQDTNYYL